MTTNHEPPTGDAMRRRVRRATVGVVGAAVAASAVLTASLAYAAGTGDQTTATANDTPSTSPAIAGDDEAAPGTTSQPSTGALAAPTQAPSASSDRRHATSGGS